MTTFRVIVNSETLLSLILGAVDAIRNNPLVKKVEETVLEFTGTLNTNKKERHKKY